MFCKNCGGILGLNQHICNSCGTKSGEGISYCEFCGEKVDNPEDEICVFCGCKMTTPEEIARRNGKIETKSQKACKFIVLALGIFSVINAFGACCTITCFGSLIISLIAMIVISNLIKRMNLNNKISDIGRILARIALIFTIIMNILCVIGFIAGIFIALFML